MREGTSPVSNARRGCAGCDSAGMLVGRLSLGALVLCVLAVTLACALVGGASPLSAHAADAGTSGSSDVGASASGPGDGEEQRSDLAVALDELVARRGDGAAATILVERDGEPVERRPYDAVGSSTQLSSDAVFSWGRISDELVWVAVMQLVEKGSLRLDDAIASRLPDAVTLPQGYRSLTMSDLMNHTTGLNVSPTTGASEAEGAGSSSIISLLGSFDVRGAYDAGELVAYSPYNVALAAAVVEQVSGEDIADYVTQHILGPLGLNDTVVSAGGRPSRVGQASDARATALASRLVPTPDLMQESLVSVIDRPALTVVGTADDLAHFCSALMSDEGCAALFEDGSSGQRLFEVSRTYPSSGVERIAHGLFALPGAPGVYGMVGTSAGYTAAAFCEPGTGTCVVVLAARASVQDEALAAVRLALDVPGGVDADGPSRARAARIAAGLPAQADEGTSSQVSSAAATPGDAPAATVASSTGGDAASGASVAGDSATASGVSPAVSGERQASHDLTAWTGVYRLASLPAHGITKILGVFRYIPVLGDEEGSLSIGLAPTVGVGGGVVSARTDVDEWDSLTRFYVGVASGHEFAQVMSDACALPASTLAIEGTLLAGGVLALLLSGGYATVGIVGAVRDHMRGLRRTTQIGCVALALLTAAAAVWVLTILLGPGAERVLLSLVATRVLSLAYVVAALALLLWLGVTRWRGTFREPRHLAGCLLVSASAIVMVLNFVYWEMLP